jgi:hypothetical protein
MPVEPGPFGEPEDRAGPLRRSKYPQTEGRGLPKDRSRVPMYFEYPLAEQEGLRPVGEEEAEVARSINRGRTLALMSVVELRQAHPTVEPDFTLDKASRGLLEVPLSYALSVADLLQAARHEGWDPADVCKNALAIQDSTRLRGEVVARHRLGPAKPPPRRVRAPRAGSCPPD